MNYCILRTKKLKTMGSIAGSAGHTFRELPTPNADPTRTHLNVTIGARDSKQLCAAIKARLPEKRRKDAVLCIEYLITASPEWFKSQPAKLQNEYFKAATKWLEERHGKENVVCLNMQNDETSPHLVAYVVPRLPDGRLSAKEFVGGRAKLSQMQTEFAEKIGKPVGLMRGVEGSKAVHTTNKQYNAALKKNPVLQPPKPPAPSLADHVTGKAKAMKEEHEAELAKHAALVEQARNTAIVSQRARAEQAKAVARLRQEVEELKAHKEEAARLRMENQKLTQDLDRQKRYFLGQVDKLKATLTTAKDAIKALIFERDGLRQRVERLAGLVTRLRVRPSLRSKSNGPASKPAGRA